MWATYTARKEWFKAAVKELEPLGLKVVVLRQTILIDSAGAPTGKPKVIMSETDFINFMKSQNIDSESPAKLLVATPMTGHRLPGGAPERRELTIDSRRSRAEPMTGEVDDDDGEDTIRQLMDLGRSAIEQRDSWKRRAIEAEAEVGALTAVVGDLRAAALAEKRYETLRNYLARELHPDYANGEGFEKIIKAELFKRIWPKIEAIEKPE